ncbi:MAG: prepilin peptidase [Dehalococcoidia bacterium]
MLSDVSLVVLLGLVGLAVGSFLNVVIDRLPHDQSLLHPPSHCPHCQHPLSVLDLVPVLSYLWLRGRCRYCGTPIPWRLPLVEALTGLLFAYTGSVWGASLLTLVSLLYLSTLVVIFFTDLEEGLILNKVVYPATALALVLAPWGPAGEGFGLWQELGRWQGLAQALAGSALGFLLMLVIYLAARGGLGFGDVKLGGLLGMALGLSRVSVALPVSFISGGLVAGALLLLRIKGRREAIPFGPFLVGGAIVTLFWGPEIYEWYRGLFGS